MRIRGLCLTATLLVADCTDRSEPAPKPATPPPTVARAAEPARVEETLTPEERRAFEAQPGFEALAEPKAGEWRERFSEPPQSLADFERAARVVPTPGRRTIFIQPLGDFPRGRSPPMERLVEYVQLFFGLEAKVLPTVANSAVLHVRTRTRNGVLQVLSGDLLNALRSKVPPTAYGLVGVTMSDLFPASSWNYVFGEASFNERVGVYSFARYDPQFHGEPRRANADQLMLARSLKVMSHEIGHMFGIAHCTAYRCLMNGSNSLEETDRAPMHLCPVCLHKLHLAARFSPKARYTALAEFYRAHGFTAEARWVDERTRRLAD